MSDIESELILLVLQGAYPGIYYRGNEIWRAHINVGGNYWVEANTPLAALKAAKDNWFRDGKPKDGMADTGP